MQGVLAIGLAKLQNIGHFEAHFFFDHPISRCESYSLYGHLLSPRIAIQLYYIIK